MHPGLPVLRGFLIPVVVLWSVFSQPVLAATPAPSGQANRENAVWLPAFSLPDLDGKPVSSQLWENNIRVLNFWASWCVPCQLEIPELAALAQAFASRDVRVVGIAIDEPEPVRRFVENYAISYPVLVDQDTAYRLAKQLGNRSGGIPFTVIIDATGRVRYVHEGVIDRNTLYAVIIGLL